jgi:hypothetical protein
VWGEFMEIEKEEMSILGMENEKLEEKKWRIRSLVAW